MGQRAGSAFDLGVNIGIAMAECDLYFRGKGDSSVSSVMKNSLAQADTYSRVLLANGIQLNIDQLRSLSDEAQRRTFSALKEAAYNLQIKALMTDDSEAIRMFNKVYGASYDLGVQMGHAEGFSSMWGYGIPADIQRNGDQAIIHLRFAHEAIQPLLTASNGKYNVGDTLWAIEGWKDPDHTGNGFKVGYQRTVLVRQAFEKVLYG